MDVYVRIVCVLVVLGLVGHVTAHGKCDDGEYPVRYSIIDYARTENIEVSGMKYLHLIKGRGENYKIPQEYFVSDFDDSDWNEATLPFGDNIICANALSKQSVLNKFVTKWPKGGANGSKSVLIVRDEFVIPSLVFDALKKRGNNVNKLIFEYIVDNDMVELALNGDHLISKPVVRDNCDGVTKPVEQILDVTSLKPGKNLLAMHVVDRGTMAYLNYKLSVEICQPQKLECDQC